MDKEQAIKNAQSALRLKCNVTHTNNIWKWAKYGWQVFMTEDGRVVGVINEWKRL